MHHFITISEFKLKLQSGNAQFGSKSAIFLSCATLKFDRWLRKTIGHLFYAPSSSMRHLIAISGFKLKLPSGNSQFGSISAIFLSHVTLKFEGWPWKIIGHLFHATSSFVYLWFDCNFVNDLVPRKCKDFNWKIFHGQVNTETRLEKMNMSNGMCVVCENGKENLEHLLIDCRHVYSIWDAVERL